MQAIFTIPAADFNDDIFKKIVALIKGQNADVVIQIRQKETSAQTKQRIDEAIEETERGENLIRFSPKEFEQLTQKLLHI